MVLEQAGHEVIATSSSRDVLELAPEAGFDAIILDVVMPEVSGFELLEELRHNPLTADIPILFLSGLGAGADRVRGLSQGADDYLVKPLKRAELMAAVYRVLGRQDPIGAVPGLLLLPATRMGGAPMLEIVENLSQDYDAGWGSMIKQALGRVYPDLSEANAGYRNFADLLKDAEKEGCVRLEYDEKRGNYRVDLVDE